MKNKVVWCQRGWNPIFYGFCPSEKAWKKEMKRLKCKGEPYPDTHGQMISFQNTKHGTVCLVTVDKEIIDPLLIIGILTHEATHVYQEVVRAMRDENPSDEFMAYSIQAITQELIQAYEETRGKLTNG